MAQRWICVLVFVVSALGAQSRTLRQATEHLEVGRYRAALEAFDKLRGRERANPDVARLRLRAWRGLGAFDEVVDVGQRWLRDHPEDGEVMVWVAGAMLEAATEEHRRPLRAMGLREAAMAQVDLALRRNPGDAAAFELKCVALANLGKTDDALALAVGQVKKRPSDVAFRLIHARVLTWLGKTGDAVGVLNEAAVAFPDAASVRIERCAVHVGGNQRNEAVRALREAVTREDCTEDDRRNAGEYVWLVAGRHHLWDEGLSLCDAWVKAHPDHGRAHWWKGYMLERAGRSDEAIAAYRAARKVGGEKLPEAAYHLGILVGFRGEFDECLKLLGEAIRLNVSVREGTRAPEDALVTLGGVYVNARNFEQAAKVLAVGGPFLQHAFELHQNLGFCLRELGGQQSAKKKNALARKSWKRSVEAYERACAAVRDADAPSTKKAQILNDTGLMYHYHLNQVAKGITYYTEALSLDPDYIDAIENMGVAKFKQRKWKEAVTWFDKVLVRSPGRATSLKLKGLAQAALNRR